MRAIASLYIRFLGELIAKPLDIVQNSLKKYRKIARKPDLEIEPFPRK